MLETLDCALFVSTVTLDKLKGENLNYRNFVLETLADGKSTIVRPTLPPLHREEIGPTVTPSKITQRETKPSRTTTQAAITKGWHKNCRAKDKYQSVLIS